MVWINSCIQLLSPAAPIRRIWMHKTQFLIFLKPFRCIAVPCPPFLHLGWIEKENHRAVKRNAKTPETCNGIAICHALHSMQTTLPWSIRTELSSPKAFCEYTTMFWRTISLADWRRIRAHTRCSVGATTSAPYSRTRIQEHQGSWNGAEHGRIECTAALNGSTESRSRPT